MIEVIFESNINTTGIKSKIFGNQNKKIQNLYINYNKGTETGIEISLFTSFNGSVYFGNIITQQVENERIISQSDNIIIPKTTIIKLEETIKIKFPIYLDPYNYFFVKSLGNDCLNNALKIYLN